MMDQTVWQDWEMYVRAWNLGCSRTFLYPLPEPPLNGYRARDAWGSETYFLPYPPWLSEDSKKQARAMAQAQWLQWKAEEAKRRKEEENRYELQREVEREAKRRKKQEAKEAAERKLAALAVRPPEKPFPKKKESSRVESPRYWREFLVAPSCDRPPLASWDPANKTYTLPPGVRISSIQDGWEEESRNYEAFVLSARKRSRDKTQRTIHPMVRGRGGN